MYNLVRPKTLPNAKFCLISVPRCPGFESRQLEERNLDRMDPSRLMNDTLSGEAKDQASLPLSRDSNRNSQDMEPRGLSQALQALTLCATP